MVVEIDHFRKFDFFGFIIWDVVIQIWLHHFGKQAFIFKTLQHLKEPTNFFIKVWVLMPFLWFSASLIRFYVKLHLFKMLLIIRSFDIHITLINWRIHFINAQVEIRHFLKVLEILVLSFILLVMIIVISVHIASILESRIPAERTVLLIITLLILIKTICEIRKAWRLKNEIFSFRNISYSSSPFLIFRRLVIRIENLVIRIQCSDRI